MLFRATAVNGINLGMCTSNLKIYLGD